MATDKAEVVWSKKENDWVGKYPNRNGKIVTGSFFTMITEFEKFMSYNWKGERTDFKDFRTYLEEGGFDPDTFKISVKLKKDV